MSTMMLLTLDAVTGLFTALSATCAFLLMGGFLRWKDGEWEASDDLALKVIGPTFLVALVIACAVPSSDKLLRTMRAAGECACKESK